MHLRKCNNRFVFLCLSCWISFADSLSWSVATPIITLGMVSRSPITMHLDKSFCDVLYQPQSLTIRSLLLPRTTRRQLRPVGNETSNSGGLANFNT